MSGSEHLQLSPLSWLQWVRNDFICSSILRLASAPHNCSALILRCSVISITPSEISFSWPAQQRLQRSGGDIKCQSWMVEQARERELGPGDKQPWMSDCEPLHTDDSRWIFHVFKLDACSLCRKYKAGSLSSDGFSPPAGLKWTVINHTQK